MRKTVELRFGSAQARAVARQQLQEARNQLESFLVAAASFLSERGDDEQSDAARASVTAQRDWLDGASGTTTVDEYATRLEQALTALAPLRGGSKALSFAAPPPPPAADDADDDADDGASDDETGRRRARRNAAAKRVLDARNKAKGKDKPAAAAGAKAAKASDAKAKPAPKKKPAKSEL